MFVCVCVWDSGNPVCDGFTPLMALGQSGGVTGGGVYLLALAKFAEVG